jgi:hypothetical protein
MEYVQIFQELEKIALSPADTVALIERIIAAMGGAS